MSKIWFLTCQVQVVLNTLTSKEIFARKQSIENIPLIGIPLERRRFASKSDKRRLNKKL